MMKALNIKGDNAFDTDKFKFFIVNTEDINSALMFIMRRLKRSDVYVHCLIEKGATPSMAPEDWKAPYGGTILKIRKEAKK